MTQNVKNSLIAFMLSAVLFLHFFSISGISILSFHVLQVYAGFENVSAISILLNERKIQFEQQALVSAGSVLVPLRGFFPARGSRGAWDAFATRATVWANAVSMVFTPGSRIAVVHGAAQTLEMPSAMIRARMYVPVRFAAQSVGAFLYWEAGSCTVFINNGSRRQHTDAGIKIEGDALFISNTLKALYRLCECVSSDDACMQHYVGRIKQGERSGMAAYENPPTFYVGNKTAQASVSWYASAIAHDAYHSKLYHDYKDAYGGRVPDLVWSGYDAEMRCLEYQIGILEKIGAPKAEIDYAKSLRGTNWWDAAVTW